MVGVPALNVDSWALCNNHELLDKYRVDAEAPPQSGEDDNEDDEGGRRSWTMVIAIIHVCSTMILQVAHRPTSTPLFHPLSLLAFARSAPLARIPSPFPVLLPLGGVVHTSQACAIIDLTMAAGTGHGPPSPWSKACPTLEWR